MSWGSLFRHERLAVVPGKKKGLILPLRIFRLSVVENLLL
jgi:hypothetical protein